MSEVRNDARDLNTFPKILARNAEQFADRTAIREKDLGIWQSWTWGQVADNVRRLALGLAALGIKRGDKVCILGDNRPHLYWCFPAIQAVGGIPVPLYQDSVADELQYVVHHAEARFAFAENQEQVDKLLQIKDDCPALEQIIYEDTRGMRHYDQPFIRSYAALQAMGDEFAQANPSHYNDEVAKGTGDDIAIIAYTSGTTGNPKGVMLSFFALTRSAELSVDFEGLQASDEVLSYLPMAWIGDHFFSIAQSYTAGFVVNCPESSDTVMLDLRELGPTYFFAPPAIFESILTQVMIRMEDAGWVKRKLFQYFMDVARRSGIQILEGGQVPASDRFLYMVGKWLVYGPLLNTLGLSRLRVAYTAGAPIGTDIFSFYRSLGINLKQLYGQTESCAYVCIQKNNDVKADTVGPPAPAIEVKLADNGEVMYRGPSTFVEYYKNPEATAETKTEDGWVHTGDAGIFDDDGHLKIIDRAKDVGQLTDGTLFAPQFIENKLKFSPFIKEAVCHGRDSDYVSAFISIDLDAVGNWAERRGMPYTSYTDLADREEVYGLVQEAVEQVNKDLAHDSALAGSQIKRFLLLHKELDADDGELTRTRKVRRRIIADRYGDMIEALYSDKTNIAVEAQVSFEDGRQGVIKADLKIRDAATFEPMRQAG